MRLAWARPPLRHTSCRCAAPAGAGAAWALPATQPAAPPCGRPQWQPVPQYPDHSGGANALPGCQQVRWAPGQAGSRRQAAGALPGCQQVRVASRRQARCQDACGRSLYDQCATVLLALCAAAVPVLPPKRTAAQQGRHFRKQASLDAVPNVPLHHCLNECSSSKLSIKGAQRACPLPSAVQLHWPQPQHGSMEAWERCGRVVRGVDA